MIEGNSQEAVRLVEEALKQPYILDEQDLFNRAAEIYFKLGNKNLAKKYAKVVYRITCADGKPYVHRWDLERAKKH